MDQNPVQVDGLRELRRDLREIGDVDKLREVREALKAAAGIVADDARRRVPTRSGQARESIRATAGGNKAFVVGGKKTVPYYGWLDFGSRTPRTGQPRSVGPWAKSGRVDGGRFLYPAIEAKRPDVVAEVERGMADAFKHRGFEVS